MKRIILFCLSSLLWLTPTVQSMNRYRLTKNLNDLLPASFAAQLSPSVQKGAIKPFFVKPSPDTQTLIVDHRLLPAIFSTRCTETVARMKTLIWQDNRLSGGQDPLQYIAHGFPHLRGDVRCATQKRGMPFDIARETERLQQDPQAFVSFGYNENIETHVHIVHAQKLENLTLNQLMLISDLFDLRSRAFSLNDEQANTFHSLPMEIQKNLLKNYFIRRVVRQVARFSRAALLPAICSAPCLPALQTAMQEVAKVLEEENQAPVSECRLPVVIKDCWWNQREQRIKPQNNVDCLVDRSLKGTKRLRTIDVEAKRGSELDAETKLFSDMLRKRIDNLSSNDNSFIVVGLADNTIDVYFNEMELAKLEALSLQQLDFIIDLNRLALRNSRIILNEAGVRMLSGLPRDMQRNLQRNYDLHMRYTTKLKIKYPRLVSKVANISQVYNRCNRYKVARLAKFAIEAGVIFYGLNWLASLNMMQNRNGALLDALKYKKTFLAGTMAALGVAQKCSPIVMQYFNKKIPALARAGVRVRNLLNAPTVRVA